MPTPSSHNEPQAVSLNSTCPDEQIPRAPEDQSQSSTPPYEDINELPTETSIVDQTGAEGDSRPSTLQGDQAHYATDGPRSPYTQSSHAMSPSTLHDVDHSELADKQAESDTGVQDLVSTYGSPSGSRGTRALVGDMSDRRVHIRRPVIRSGSRVDSRHVAQYSIPEADIWHSHVSGRTPITQLSSRSSTNPDMSTSTAADEAWEGYEVDDDYTYPEDSPSFMPCDPTSLRVIYSCASRYLRPGSRFVGNQQSERQVYDVQVEIKHVDLRESFLCGYLRIQGLTEDHPTLTTYFEGEIIGSKYGFNTKHPAWGANDRIDMSHWAKFGAFRPYQRPAKKGGIYTIKDHLQKENIFMRWKEHFLVPNHRVRTIHGASFEGFYYICFNQVEGVVHGIYFHSKSEKFQQLELKHVEDKGCTSAVEFR